jgi:threonyl-tRNA synthetase
MSQNPPQIPDDLAEPEITSKVDTIRHSTAHLMAHAIQKLWPDAQFGIGPTVENGFYYDFKMAHTLVPEDLKAIEKEMKKLTGANAPFVRNELPVADALEFFRSKNQPFKVEIIETLRDQFGAKTVSTYTEGTFVDLCRGPHVEKTGQLQHFKLLSVAGAYWRGNEKNPQLQRLYGCAFETEQELKDHLFALEEAKKRDHRKLGVELDLFSLHPEAPASPFFHPKGTVVYNRLQKLVRDLYAGPYPYDEIITPQIMDVALWHKSGHWENYRENMYFTEFDERKYAVKPMNCPASTFVYASQKRSYRDLPLRLADFGRLHRYERSGVTAGITRVRTFCQDDAHIFCTPEQIESEIGTVVDMILKTFRLFEFTDPKVYLSTRPEKRVGSDALWDQAEGALEAVLKKLGLSYSINKGDGAFYGPKIDFNVRDAIKRYHQLATIQLDFSMPERFDLHYIGADNSKHRPVMVHRAVLGSIERFMGVLIEHTAGALPFWLSPVQAVLIPIADAHVAYCEAFAADLRRAGFRVTVDAKNGSMGGKVRESQIQKIPYALVAGDREVADKQFAVRKYGERDSKVESLDDIRRQFADLNAVPMRAYE